MSALAEFEQKWCHPEYPSDPVSEADLLAVEQAFSVQFPADYRTQILAVGRPTPTLALLDAIVENGVDLHDLSGLIDPKAIPDDTYGWRNAGMPSHFLTIGNDSLGNQFCFDIDALNASAKTGGSVYFWDLDFGTTEKVADSFSQWISLYLGPWSDGLTYADF